MRTGTTDGANSAVPLGPSAGFEPLAIDAIRSFYTQRNLPVRLTIPERIGKPALKVIGAGWTLQDEQVVWEAGDAFGVASIGDVPEGALEHHRRRLALG